MGESRDKPLGIIRSAHHRIRVQGEHPAALKNLLESRLARPGGLLIQSPFDVETYEDASCAPERFALAKHMFFSNICRHLGAKEVIVEQIDLRTRSGKTSLDVKGEKGAASAQVTIKNEELEKFRAQMQLRDEFAGGEPNVAAAEQLLRTSGLWWSDPSMRALLDMRGAGPNQLTSRKLVLSLSSEAKSNLNVVGRLKIPGFLKQLAAEYDRVVREEYDYTLTALVRF